MPTRFAPKVAILNRRGDHVRFVPAQVAQTLVRHGSATPGASSGRVREIALTRTAETSARRIGAPSAASLGVRFYRWIHLEDSASRIVEHHPRATYDPPQE